jgi:hypothetical protein
MDKVQKPSDFECNTPSTELFKFDIITVMKLIWKSYIYNELKFIYHLEPILNLHQASLVENLPKVSRQTWS